MVECSACGARSAGEARFCASCGARLASEPAAPARDQRKTVTAVFTDLVGSTALASQLDPEALRALMSRYYEAMRAPVERHGGRVDKFIGDAVVAFFGVPVAHEDDALRAVRAAAGMRAALVELNEDLDRRFGVTVQIRTGVNTGDVLAADVSRPDSFTVGDAVNVAARLEQHAAPGEVLLGEATYQLVRHARPRRAGGAAGGQGEGGAPDRVSPRRGRRVRAVVASAARLAAGRARRRGAARGRGVRAGGSPARLPPVHDPRHCRRGEVAVDGRGGRHAGGAGHGDARPLPVVRGGDHLLATGRDAARRGRHRRRRRRRGDDGEARQAGRG